jgi:hypothetical protein
LPTLQAGGTRSKVDQPFKTSLDGVLIPVTICIQKYAFQPPIPGKLENSRNRLSVWLAFIHHSAHDELL